MPTKALLMHPDDDVAVAIVPLTAGDVVRLPEGRTIAAGEPIPFGHKLAVRPVAKGQLVMKYGQPIGRATADIAAGDYVHVHNVESCRGRGDLSS